jgi:tetratricopeptide (TPR) repeat protein
MGFLDRFKQKKAAKKKKTAGEKPEIKRERYVGARRPVEAFERWHVGDLIDNRYEVRRILKGGMGVVYICVEQKTSMPYAIKTFQDKYLLDEKVRKRFVCEAETWIRLEKHRNVVKAYAVQIFSGKPYIFLEHVPSSKDKKANLRDYISSLNLAKALNLAVQFCDGMVYATKFVDGLVHRDIKPENLMITPDGVGKVTDFGLVKALGAPKAESPMGTPEYMSPEQFLTMDLIVSADIYSFGVVLYEMLSRRPPFSPLYAGTEVPRISQESDIFNIIFRLGFKPAIAERLVSSGYRSLEETVIASASELSIATGLGEEDTQEIINVAKWIFYKYHHINTVPKNPRSLNSNITVALASVIMKCLEKKPKNRYRSFEDLREALDDVYFKISGKRIPVYAGPPLEAWEMSNKGISLIGLGKLDEGIAILKQALELDPNHSLAHSNLGSAYLRKGWLDKAIEELKLAIELDPNNTGAHMNLGNAWDRKGWLDKAIEEHKLAIELDPNHSAAHHNLGSTYVKKGWLDKAIKEYKRAIELNPNYTLAHNDLGNLYGRKGWLDKAIEELKLTIVLDPNDSKAHNNLGRAYHDKGWTDQAIAEYKRAIELDRNNAKAHYNLGSTYVKKGWLDKAIEELKLAIELDPNHSLAHYNLGNAYLRKGALDKAIEGYKRAIELDPNHSASHSNLGNAYIMKGWIDQAMAEYKQAIELDRNNAEAHTCLGNIYSDKGWLDKAIEEHKWAIELDPKNAVAHFNLASAYYTSKRFDLAWKHVRIAEKLGIATQYIVQLISTLGKVSREP